MAQSHLEAKFLQILKALQIPLPQEEVRFHPTRKWRVDFLWEKEKIAVEIEGAVWARGRHTRGSGFIADCTKYNSLAKIGYRLYRLTSEHLKDPDYIFELLGHIGAVPETKHAGRKPKNLQQVSGDKSS